MPPQNETSYLEGGPEAMAVTDPTKYESKEKQVEIGKVITLPTPLPMAALSAIGVALFTNSLIITVLFPFSPLVVTTFGVTDDTSQVGYYAGMLASCFFIGSLLSGPVWGHISDIIGRKTVMLIGLTGNMIFSLWFGFSSSFPMAVSTRFILGLVCTVLVVAKTSITEICDDSNVAQGFAVYGLCWGLGLITGPLVGGFLVTPALQYPGFFSEDGLFGIFPFLLPNLVLSCMTVVGIILCVLYLKETLGNARNAVPKSVSENGNKEGKGDMVESGVVEDEDPGLFWAFFGNRETLMTLAILCLAGFMFTGFEELFPLWALTEWDLGGLGFVTSNVGLAQGASGLTLIPVTLFLYPWLINKIGAVGALQLSLFTGVFQAAIPLVRLFGDNKVVLQIACIIIFAIRSFNETGMAAMFILFNNSIKYPKYLGVLNGAQTTGLSLFQAAAPWTIGSSFAWSIGLNAFFPLDYHFAWLILGLLHVVALLLTLALPKDINSRKFQSGDPPMH